LRCCPATSPTAEATAEMRNSQRVRQERAGRKMWPETVLRGALPGLGYEASLRAGSQAQLIRLFPVGYGVTPPAPRSTHGFGQEAAVAQNGIETRAVGSSRPRVSLGMMAVSGHSVEAGFASRLRRDRVPADGHFTAAMLSIDRGAVQTRVKLACRFTWLARSAGRSRCWPGTSPTSNCSWHRVEGESLIA